MRLQGETRELFVELSEAEVLQAGEELAKAVEELADERAALSTWEKSVKSARETRKEEIADLENETADLAEVVRTGREKRDVACNWLYALAAGYAFLVRSDDGSLVTHRKLKDEERQMEIGEPPFAEPTPEQLEEWLKTLPVNEEQVLPEGHAEEVQAEDRALDLGDAIVTDEYGEPLEEPISAGSTTPQVLPVGQLVQPPRVGPGETLLREPVYVLKCSDCGAEEGEPFADQDRCPHCDIGRLLEMKPAKPPRLNPTVSELAAMSDEQVAQLARRK